jgi:hypothetical protein
MRLIDKWGKECILFSASSVWSLPRKQVCCFIGRSYEIGVAVSVFYLFPLFGTCSYFKHVHFKTSRLKADGTGEGWKQMGITSNREGRKSLLVKGRDFPSGAGVFPGHL